jgi:hypothetical protein
MDISAVTQSQFLIQIIFLSSPLSPSENHAPNASNIGDDTGDETGTGAATEKVSSPKEGENRAQNGVGDGNGGSDVMAVVTILVQPLRGGPDQEPPPWVK